MWRARIAIRCGSAERPLFTAHYHTEADLDEALNDLERVLVYAVSVKKQYTDEENPGWRTKSALGLMGDS
jgi:hypothetical protein